MGTSEEFFWLCKLNPKFVEFLERVLILMEQTQVLPRQEEKSRGQEAVPESLLTVPEAAQRLRLSEYTLRTWINQRRIPRVKIGRRTLLILPTWTTSSKPQPWNLENLEGIKNFFWDSPPENQEAMATNCDLNLCTKNLPPSANLAAMPF